jgi:hypothetical protein
MLAEMGDRAQRKFVKKSFLLCCLSLDIQIMEDLT